MSVKKHNLPRVTKIKKLVKAGDYEAGAMAVRDILTDLRHYCDAHNIDFAYENNMAYEHYCVEVHSKHG